MFAEHDPWETEGGYYLPLMGFFLSTFFPEITQESCLPKDRSFSKWRVEMNFDLKHKDTQHIKPSNLDIQQDWWKKMQMKHNWIQ